MMFLDFYHHTLNHGHRSGWVLSLCQLFLTQELVLRESFSWFYFKDQVNVLHGSTFGSYDLIAFV